MAAVVADCRSQAGVAPNRSWWAEAPWGCESAAVVEGVARRGCHLDAAGAAVACCERKEEGEEEHQHPPGTDFGVVAAVLGPLSRQGAGRSGRPGRRLPAGLCSHHPRLASQGCCLHSAES